MVSLSMPTAVAVRLHQVCWMPVLLTLQKQKTSDH